MYTFLLLILYIYKALHQRGKVIVLIYLYSCRPISKSKILSTKYCLCYFMVLYVKGKLCNYSVCVLSWFRFSSGLNTMESTQWSPLLQHVYSVYNIYGHNLVLATVAVETADYGKGFPQINDNNNIGLYTAIPVYVLVSWTQR